MNPKAKKTFWYIVALICAAAMLFFAFRGVKWSDFVDGLRQCNKWWIALSMAISILAIWLRGLRWRLLMLPVAPDVKRRESYDAYAVGYLANLALPRAGEIVKCGLMARTGKISFEASLGSMVAERAVDVLFLLLAFVLMVLFSRFGGFLMDNVWAPLSARLPFSVLWIVAAVVVLIVVIYILLKRNADALSARSKFFTKCRNIWHGLVGGLVAGFRMDHKWGFWLLTIGIQCCYWAMSFCTLRAFPEAATMTAMDALFIMVVGAFGWAVPVQGGFGAYHLLVSMTLVPIYGLTQAKGLIIATISHESQIVTFILCGLLSLLSIWLAGRSSRKSGEPSRQL